MREVTSSGKGAIPGEHTAKISNTVGTLSMANAGPNSGGSQFSTWWTMHVLIGLVLDHPNAVFGKVVEGFETVVNYRGPDRGGRQG